jgi:hypothetical protein
LPFAEVERDRTDKQDADCRRDAGPFDAFHLAILARPWGRRQAGGAPNQHPAEITHQRRLRAAAGPYRLAHQPFNSAENQPPPTDHGCGDDEQIADTDETSAHMQDTIGDP